MNIVCTVLLNLVVIWNSIESSSQSQPPAESTVRARSRSPTLRHTFPSVLGFRFEDLEFIRLSPHNSLNRVFELRRYIFPPNTRVGLKSRNCLKPIPAGEQIVLSTSNGDVYAILEKAANRHVLLHAICEPTPVGPRRAKINMNSGAVKELDKKEIEECPITSHAQIPKSYAVFHANTGIFHTGSSSQLTGSSDDGPSPGSRHDGPPPSLPSPPGRNTLPAESRLQDSSESLTLRQTFPNLLGYKFRDLQFIRLRPRGYSHRIFKLQIYVFLPNERIGLRKKTYVLEPIPTGQQIVLSTLDGDVYAILQKSSSGSLILRPIFTLIFGIFERVKINMNSGAFEGLSTEEKAEIPVTNKDKIPNIYRVYRV